MIQFGSNLCILVRTVLIGITGFMGVESEGSIGSVKWTEVERRKLATQYVLFLNLRITLSLAQTCISFIVFHRAYLYPSNFRSNDWKCPACGVCNKELLPDGEGPKPELPPNELLKLGFAYSPDSAPSPKPARSSPDTPPALPSQAPPIPVASAVANSADEDAHRISRARIDAVIWMLLVVVLAIIARRVL
jgi:ubiquitin-conjugating enzyme E2 J1